MSASTEELFFKSSQFAVVGASKDETKVGNKLLKWYLERELNVTPVHPKEDEIEKTKTIKKLGELKSPKTTSVSIVTPPKITLDVLKEGKELGIPAFWIQPGAEDNQVRAYVISEGLTDKVVLGGPCVLVSGDKSRKSLL
ncbi:hypothetical protein RSOLAG1IB_10198 [Rhizoctonia solani AG-1 IB]|uniref:CoA-binding domain-containing protein n=1 Tax=Thanatephorus cucumeris (strain AG1-IB / isolate 7/3/14) TaxID=1108050 RepID=M5BYU0_THACB|nr:hypothetical protein BN14_06431 [Rhizoctonia solani AG-1 IB]CEL62096.1 hypothetical protein RSOLAG1IB_10198 [Rhizoctonia solani AG-1 IB]